MIAYYLLLALNDFIAGNQGATSTNGPSVTLLLYTNYGRSYDDGFLSTESN